MPLSTAYVTNTEDVTWFMFRHNSFYDTHPSRCTMMQEMLSSQFVCHVTLCLQQKDKRRLKHLSVFAYRSCKLQATTNKFTTCNKMYDIITISQDGTRRLYWNSNTHKCHLSALLHIWCDSSCGKSNIWTFFHNTNINLSKAVSL